MNNEDGQFTSKVAKTFEVLGALLCQLSPTNRFKPVRTW